MILWERACGAGAEDFLQAVLHVLDSEGPDVGRLEEAVKDIEDVDVRKAPPKQARLAQSGPDQLGDVLFETCHPGLVGGMVHQGYSGSVDQVSVLNLGQEIGCVPTSPVLCKYSAQLQQIFFLNQKSCLILNLA